MRSQVTSPNPYSPSVVCSSPIRKVGYSETTLLGIGGGDEAGQPAPEVHRDPERLQLAADDVGAVERRRLENAERDRIDADDRERAGLVRESGDLGRPDLDRAEIARVLEVDAGRVLRERLPERSNVDEPALRVEGHTLDAHPGAAVPLDDREPLG